MSMPVPIPSTVAAEVRRLIGEGCSVARVAKLLGVSRRTVDRDACDGRDAHIVRGTTMRPLGGVDVRGGPLDRGRRGSPADQ
jgi:hypothetical protein